MKDYELASMNQGLDDYRGAITYRQEYGYKMVTLTVGVGQDEKSHVSTHASSISNSEEAEHLQGVDLYHFPVADGERIQLMLEMPEGNQEAWYTVHPDSIAAEPSSFYLNIGRSSQSLHFDYVYTQDALDEALCHYADQMPHWLNETPDQKPLHEVGDFGR